MNLLYVFAGCTEASEAIVAAVHGLDVIARTRGVGGG
jgi:hypothetical protein